MPSQRRDFRVRTILKNMASVLGGEATVRVANLVAALAIARLYGPAILGLYGACLAVVTTLAMFADNGLQLSAVTEIASVSSSQSFRIVGELYLSKTILCILVVLLLLSIGLAGGFPPSYWLVGALVTFRTLLQSYSQLQIAILKSLFRMHLIGIIQAVHAGILILAVSFAFISRWLLLAFLAVLVAGQALELLLMSAAVFHAGIRPRWPAVSSCLSLMKRSFPLGLGYALMNLIVRLDVLVLSVVVSLTEMGQFSAADNLLVVAYLGAWLFGSVLFPEMVKLAGSADQLDRFLNRWIRFSFLAIVPAALLCYLFAPRAIVALYGSNFARAGELASWMVLACPFIISNSLYLHHTIAIGAKRAYLWILFAATLLAVGLDLFLARQFGAAGVVAAILIRESLLFLVFSLRHFHVGRSAVELGVSAS